VSDSPSRPNPTPDSGSSHTLEIAHVLFTDIVGYSKLPMEEQEQLLMKLQETVRQTPEFARAQADDQLIRLPTGDGMALVFFGDAEAPVRCALELGRSLRSQPALKLRMGIHTGPVYRIADINANRNVAGGGINIAQRVMDCGDAGHILLSSAEADVLRQLKAWSGTLHDVGEVEVKHGVRLHIYNLYTNEAGNPGMPTKVDARRAASLAAKRKRTSMEIAAGIVILALIAAGSRLFFPRKARALGESDTIVLADFDNKTGDTIFDDTLKQALSISLRQSPFLNIVSDGRIGATLKLMTRPANTRLAPQVAREVCQRAGSKAYIAGLIAPLGKQYVIGLDAVTCQTGEMLTQQQATAAWKEKVLDALGNAAAKLREELGESLNTVEKFATPLPNATTPSLDALKAYSLGLIKDRQNDAEAIPFFKRAIELDPNFASAYEGVAVAYLNLGESGLARENFTKAFELSARASERERLIIVVRYYEYVTGELEKAIENYQIMAQVYPRDALAHGNLGGLYGTTGRFEKSAVETLEALRLNPDSGANYGNLILAYTALNRLDDAKSIYNKAMARGLDDPLTRLSFFGVAFLEGDTAEMNRQIEWSAGKAEGEEIFLSAEADIEAFYGRLRSAREYSRRAIESALRSGENETAAQWKLDGAIREAEFGNSDRARREATSALALSSNHDSEILAALTLARAGDEPQAEKLAKELAAHYPLDTLVISYWMPVIRAALEIGRRNPSQALEALEAANHYELANPGAWPGLGAALYPIYLRGEARLQLHQGSEAGGELQKFLDHRGLLRASPLGPLAYLGLARAYALQHDTAQARAAYENFLTIWKDADLDIPILVAAKAEYAKLR
jgi:tetratricopeptide (TPR) repeat protein/class 3 adenylate cyclase